MEKKYKLLADGDYNVCLGQVSLYKDTLSNLMKLKYDNNIIKFKDEIYLMFNKRQSNSLSELISRIINKGYRDRLTMVFSDDTTYKKGQRFFIGYYYAVHPNDLFLLHEGNWNRDSFNYCKFMVDINTGEKFSIDENIIYEDTQENNIKVEKIIELYNGTKTMDNLIKEVLSFKNIEHYINDYTREDYTGNDIVCLNDLVIYEGVK